MDLDTWVSLGSLAVAFLGLGGLVVGQNRATRAELGAKIDQNHQEAKADHQTAMTAIESLRAETKTDIRSLRAETKTDIQSLRTETKTDHQTLIGAIESVRTESRADHNALATSLSVIEQRTYDMATRLIASPATERPTG